MCGGKKGASRGRQGCRQGRKEGAPSKARRADTNGTPWCGRATGGPNRRPGPNQPGTPAPGGRGTDAPRPPPVRTRFNGTTPPDLPFLRPGAAGGAGDRGRDKRREGREGRAEGRRTAAPQRTRPNPVRTCLKKGQPSCSQAPTILLVGNIAKQGSSSANVAGSPLVDQTGEDSPRAGRRATWLPRATQDQATTSPSAISTCGRRTIASSGQVGFLLRAAIGIGRIASFWDSINSESV